MSELIINDLDESAAPDPIYQPHIDPPTLVARSQAILATVSAMIAEEHPDVQRTVSTNLLAMTIIGHTTAQGGGLDFAISQAVNAHNNVVGAIFSNRQHIEQPPELVDEGDVQDDPGE